MPPLIALVSDDEGSIGTISMLLAKTGYQPLWCGASLGVYETVRAQQPDLVLIDLRPERVDAGLLALNRLRLDPATRNVPVILLTAGGVLAFEAERAMGRARCDVLYVPCSAQTLLHQVAQSLSPLERAVGLL